MRLIKAFATIGSIHGIGLPAWTSVWLAKSRTKMIVGRIELINRLRQLRYLLAGHGTEGGNQAAFKRCEAWPINKFLRMIVPRVNGINRPFAIKSGQVIVKNAGIQVSRMLYTKHSVEKRILIQVTALIDLGCFVLSKLPDRIRSLAIIIGVGPCAHQSWGVRCKNGVAPC